MNKTKYKLSGVFSSLLLLAGCTMDNPVGALWPAEHGTMFVKKNASVDSIVLGELVVLNKGEIAAAALAKGKATHFTVKHYASYLYKQHNDNLHQTLKLSRDSAIAPSMGSVALSLEKQGRQELAQLQAASKQNFDREYIAYMIHNHQNALKLLDNAIAQASNSQLIQLLKSTRHHVEMHLLKAQQIQKRL